MRTKRGKTMLAKTAAQLVAEAKAQIENLSPVAVATELQRGSALLVDLRESAERVEHGVIPGTRMSASERAMADICFR